MNIQIIIILPEFKVFGLEALKWCSAIDSHIIQDSAYSVSSTSFDDSEAAIVLIHEIGSAKHILKFI